jgi:hypothetical protein
MDFSSLPAYVANTQYSPNSDAFPSPDPLDTYFSEPYATSPDCAFGEYYDNSNSYYYRTTQSLEIAPSWRPFAPENSTGTLPPVSKSNGAVNASINAWSDLSFNYTGGYNEAFTDPSPLSMSSRYSSPASSRDSVKRENPSSNSIQLSRGRLSPPSSNFQHPEDQKSPHRKRGRPRLYRPASGGSTTTPINKASRSQCMPHTEVERKYREKLNTELERLRRAVPILPQSDATDATSAAKPSKSMVLAVAIDYIKELERQRDTAVEEVERLGGKVRFGTMGDGRKHT